MGNSVKTDNFLKAIRKHVKAQKKQMLTEVSQIKEEQLTITKKKAEQDSEKLIADRLEQKRTEMTSILAKKTRDGQRELFQARVKMTEEVFDRAKKKLLAYTQTPAYRERLEQDAGQIAALFGDNDCVLYVNEKDLGAAQHLRGLFGGNTEIMADKTIIIGGMKGFCKKMGIIADQTLDSKLQAQRTWFIENAELSVL